MSHFTHVRFDKHSTQFTGQAWQVTALFDSTFTWPNRHVNEHLLFGSKTNIGFMKIHWLQTEFPLTIE